MATTTCEITWLQHLFCDLSILHQHLATLYCDNQATSYIAANFIYYEHTKHIEIDCHLVREKAEVGRVQTTYIPSNLQVVNEFTKSLVQIISIFLYPSWAS